MPNAGPALEFVCNINPNAIRHPGLFVHELEMLFFFAAYLELQEDIMEIQKPVKKAKTQSSKNVRKVATPEPVPTPVPETEVAAKTEKKNTDWEQFRKDLKSADGSLTLSEIDQIVALASAPRRKRGDSPNGWLSSDLRSLIG